MTLDILIPHYSESADEVTPLLDSIALQQNVNFSNIGVIIAHDGPDATELPETEWRERYPFALTFVHAERGGVSHTRNAALDASTADYVIFADADDMFCHACGLYIVFEQMQSGFDTMVSRFVEESRHPETKKPVYINHDMDSTFVHGKVHRRRYLVDNNIRFNDELTVHEDSYFNILAQNIAPKERAVYCPTPFYLWRWRDASVCRHDPKYILKTYGNMLDSNDALVDEFTRRGMVDKARFYATFMILDAYYTLNKKEWRETVNADYRAAVEGRFATYFAKHKAEWLAVDERERMQISLGVRQRSVMEGMPMESITIDDWLAQVERLGAA